MKIYRHYKQKYYKLFGIAKHSETLTDLAYYECLYKNPTGQFWVRPSELFFGTIEINGKMVPRFEEVTLRVESNTTISNDQIALIRPIVEKTIGPWDDQWFHSQFRNHTQYFLLTAYLDDKLVGFKLGYEEDQWTFYSWLGAVLPEYQKLGAATSLMLAQHDWCQKQGYHKIRTQSRNRFKDMIKLNLKHGFDIIGTHTSSDPQGLKIVLEKKLVN